MARRRFLIDRIRDEDLPRLQPRPLPYVFDKLVLLLVGLRDCAPYLETWPPDLDELAAVATRLLLLPGGPLVLEDGVLTRLFPPRPGEAAFGHDRLWVSTARRGLIGFSDNMVRFPNRPHQPLGRSQRAGLVRRVKSELGKFYWWRTASTFEMLDEYRMDLALPMTDPMLAGVPAKEDDHEEEMAH